MPTKTSKNRKHKERPSGEPATHTLEGAAPLQTTQLRKGAPLRGDPASFARIQRKGASAPPAPSPRKYKNKTCLMNVGVGLRVSANDLNPFQIEQKDHYNSPEAEKGRRAMPKEPERASATQP